MYSLHLQTVEQMSVYQMHACKIKTFKLVIDLNRKF